MFQEPKTYNRNTNCYPVGHSSSTFTEMKKQLKLSGPVVDKKAKMNNSICFLVLISLSCLLHGFSSFPLCTDSWPPMKQEYPLMFCSYNGSVCCNTTQDLLLQKQFEALNVVDPACASLLKSTMCAICDQFSAHLFEIDSRPRKVPVLCNTTSSMKSHQSKVGDFSDFCTKLWNTCGNVSLLSSPFAPPTQGRMTDHWHSKQDFCEAFGGSEDAVCFNGESVSFSQVDAPPPPAGLCLEKIGNGAYINLVPHPDGSNRAFVSNQQGQIWLVTIPHEGSSGILGINDSEPFLDITDQVLYDTEFGLMSMAFHPNFVNNGRFFLSFNCDKIKHAGCSGRCSCNTDVNCDPSKLSADGGVQPCQYHVVVAEFTVNGTAPEASMAKSSNPSEVRRIFTMGLPYKGGHAGQILFGPADGYLYLTMGDGSHRDDPYNFAQNKKSLLGKIMRLDIDNIPSAKEICEKRQWGNYSIPRDNPYIDTKELEPEIWALGFRNPWRCSFDSERPSYFFCGDCGQDQYEEVDLVTKGGNYGWRVYEGHMPFFPRTSPGGNTSASSISPIFPVMGYNHSNIGRAESASITGSYFYRSMTDPCMYKRYLYMDLYAEALWAGTENPENSGNFSTTKIPFRCAHDSLMQCNIMAGGSTPSLGYVFSFAEDNKKDVYVLTSTGVYRVTRPSRCNLTCAKEHVVDLGTHRQSSDASKSRKMFKGSKDIAFFLLFLVLYPGFDLVNHYLC